MSGLVRQDSSARCTRVTFLQLGYESANERKTPEKSNSQGSGRREALGSSNEVVASLQRPGGDSVLPQRYEGVNLCGSSGRQIARQ